MSCTVKRSKNMVKSGCLKTSPPMGSTNFFRNIGGAKSLFVKAFFSSFIRN